MAADSGTRTLVRPRRRIASLDALRGLTLVSMIAYHACWDLVYLFHADWDWYRAPARTSGSRASAGPLSSSPDFASAWGGGPSGGD